MARAGERGTVLLAPRPDRLVLCNRYQQRLTSTESGALLPYELMIVEKEDGVLGDGLTKCVVLRLRGDTYYLLRGNDGSLPPGVSLNRDADILADTIRVLPRRNVVLESPDGSSRRPLAAGTLLVRLFGADGKYFVRQASVASPPCGWVAQREASAWELIRTSSPATAGVSLAQARSMVESDIADVNGMLRALYLRQGRGGNGDTIPQLHLEAAPETLRCSITPSSAAPAYRASSAYSRSSYPGGLGYAGCRALQLRTG